VIKSRGCSEALHDAVAAAVDAEPFTSASAPCVKLSCAPRLRKVQWIGKPGFKENGFNYSWPSSYLYTKLSLGFEVLQGLPRSNHSFLSFQFCSSGLFL
jgi:hypothetical protein